MTWKSNKGSGNEWSPKKDAEGNLRFQASSNDLIDGYYINKKENVGIHSSNVYTIKDETGKDIDIWGDHVLNSEMDKIRIGTYIRIQWRGRKFKKRFESLPASKMDKDNTYNDWEVFTNDEVPPLSGNSIAASKNNSGQRVAAGSTANQSFATNNVDDDLPF